MVSTARALDRGGSSPHTRGAPPTSPTGSEPWRIIPAYAGSTCRGGRVRSSTRDHPRIRGEHGVGLSNQRRSEGSSPHTRGALVAENDPSLARGIIPAYAGSTHVSRRRRSLIQDHPRIRGEHVMPSRNVNGVTWIIPAYAGSTRRRLQCTHHSPDHPRIRGEHVFQLMTKDPWPGSSPHTRGAHLAVGVQGVGDRIIPAYAGSTYKNIVFIPVRIGSSPHTRGALEGERVHAVSEGIIPAYAGSTPSERGLTSRPADHPRIRGEHETDTTTSRLRAGSSPHTRGARLLGAAVVAGGGIIPAYAGSTLAGRRGARRGGDHPRIRGEHMPRMNPEEKGTGSSPHTRGAHVRPAPVEVDPLDHPRIRGEHGGFPRRAMCRRGSSPHTRGAPHPVPRRAGGGGIIPAYAGSTCPLAGPVTSTTGSSPHTRGALGVFLGAVGSDGIIPAYAGSTPPRPTPSRRPRDHPRIRGEHLASW